MATIANVIVDGGRNMREVAAAAFKERLQALCSLVDHFQQQPEGAIQTMLLPAGYFCTTSVARVHDLADRAAAALVKRQPHFDIVWGIDGWTSTSKSDATQGPAGYPFFVFALRKGQTEPQTFQQISTSAGEGSAPGLETMWGDRSILLNGTRTALLICGESWSDQLLEKVRAAKPEVLLIPAHRNVNLMRDKNNGWAGLSWHLRLSKVRRRQPAIPIVLSEHTRSPDRHEYAWGAKRVTQLSLPDDLSSFFTVRLLTPARIKRQD